MYYEMSTTHVHGDLVGRIYIELGNLLRNLMNTKEVLLRSETGALVHWGKKYVENVSLVDISNFDPKVITTLGTVEPDLMLFHKNPYIRADARVAGFPDLVVEVWSESNDLAEHNMKHQLYSTSHTTEHWYIEQNSTEMECWIGKNRQPNKDLTKPLVTVGGLPIDISDIFTLKKL
ncbi:MAG: Uma2 family endonuclease [Firmicutes bacterium]|nr:Uma2 family endonuclease [Bacillota bacterium]